MDADDPWLVRFTFEQAGWRVEAWHGHRARQLLPLEDLLTAAKECIASVDSQLKMNFNTELARYA
jgi:hypothetical protein